MMALFVLKERVFLPWQVKLGIKPFVFHSRKQRYKDGNKR
jgi:hypothetical protein